MNTPHPLNTGKSLAAGTAASQLIRTPDQRVRVFVSSTLDELAAERAAAREAITQLHLAPVLFESGARPGKCPTKWTDLARKRKTLPSILNTGTKFPGKASPRQTFLSEIL